MQDDPLYATQDLRLKNRPALNARLAEIFATLPSQVWLDALEQAGVQAGPIYKMDEVFADAQVQHLGMVVDVPKGNGSVSLVGQPIGLSRTPAAFERTLPEAGADNDEVFAEIGLARSEIEALRRERVI